MSPSAQTPAEVIAHRGASGYAPENTLAAFERALRMGASGLELDVQQTKDGRLVVIHDTDFKRVAGSKLRVGQATYAQVSRLDAGAWFAPEFKGEPVPLLEAVLDSAERAAPGRAWVNVELKHPLRAYGGLEARVLDAVRARPEWDGRVLYSSFNHRSLYKLRGLDARARLGYLVGLTRRWVALKEARELACESVHLSLRQAQRPWVKAVHDAGMKVLVYTVNKAADFARLSALGVDGVFSNYPDLAAGEGR